MLCKFMRIFFMRGKMMSLHGSLFTLQLILTLAEASPSPVIDQSQTGDLNVHINLKDLRIFALLKGKTEEYVDYDYAYDYSEMTIKPNNNTTPKPANASTLTEENATEIITTQLVTEKTTQTRNVTTTASPPTKLTTLTNSSTSGMPDGTSSVVLDVTPSVNAPTATTVFSLLSGTAATSAPPAPKNATVCRKNYVMNKDGECEFTIYDSSTNALLKLVKLSQKLKLRRENRRSNSTKDTEQHLL